ncbi:MAG TPA: hypothetical protein ENJ02_09925 [Chloroflexi bacterium]|nr:hypothetical protein [Chloroflexota bacterium]
MSPTSYHSFLLRMWGTRFGDTVTWRVMLVNPHTQEAIGFDGLDGLLDYLNTLTADAVRGEPEERKTP